MPTRMKDRRFSSVENNVASRLQAGVTVCLSALISTDPSIWMSFIHLERPSLNVPCNETGQHRPKLHIGPVQFQSGLAKMLYRLNIAMRIPYLSLSANSMALTVRIVFVYSYNL